MPHVVLDQKIDLQLLSKQFEQIFQKEPVLIKIHNIFVDAKNRCSLLPTVVIDKTTQQFFIEVSTNEKKTTIRLYPETDPEKTDGVKTALGLITRKIQQIFPNSQVTKTNIEKFIPA